MQCSSTRWLVTLAAHEGPSSRACQHGALDGVPSSYMLLLTAALVDRTAPSSLPRSLVEHAANFAGSRATFPEIFDDATSCGELNPSALATTTALMREYTGRDARFATFAGGCFWGLELAYQRTPGVLCTCAGYTQGHAISPSYAEVCSEATGHTEAVLLLYDHSLVSCATLAVVYSSRGAAVVVVDWC